MWPYAGTSEYLLCRKVRSADNQHMATFFTGEGSFNISFRRRSDYRFPWKVSACFNISQKEKYILQLFQQWLGCGTLRSRPDGVWYYEVNTLGDIQRSVIPFFQTFPFLSQKKQRDFATFCTIVSLLLEGKHLFERGVREILDLRRTMNNGGKRKFSEREILEQYGKSSETIRQTSRRSPNGVKSDEDIVRSHGRP